MSFRLVSWWRFENKGIDLVCIQVRNYKAFQIFQKRLLKSIHNLVDFTYYKLEVAWLDSLRFGFD